MPQFRVELDPTGDKPVWEDPPSATRPSRVVGDNDRQPRKVVYPPGTVLTLVAINDGQPGPLIHSFARFTMWAVEYPEGNGGPPVHDYPIGSTTSVQTFQLDYEGHYTFAVRQEAGGSVFPNAGGVVVIHVEVETP